MELWEILVPTEMIRDGQIWPITTKYHQVWDAKVEKLSGGLTILKPTTGIWIAPNGQHFKERMIPVRIACNRATIEEIADITANYYKQQAVMYYKVSDDVFIVHYQSKKINNKIKMVKDVGP